MKKAIMASLLICLFVLISLAGCTNSNKADSGDNTIKGKRTAKVLDADILVSHAPFSNISSNTENVADTSLYNDQATPAVSFDPVTKKYLTVYTSVNSNGVTEIHGALCKGSDSGTQGISGNKTSMSCGNDFQISDGTAIAPQTQPKVAFDPLRKRFLVIWTDSSETYSRLRGQFVSSTFNTTYLRTKANTEGIENFALNTTPDAINYRSQSDPDIVFNPKLGKFVIAWLDTSSKDSNQYTLKKASNGVQIGSLSILPKWALIDTFRISKSSGNPIIRFIIKDASGVTVDTIVPNGINPVNGTIFTISPADNTGTIFDFSFISPQPAGSSIVGTTQSVSVTYEYLSTAAAPVLISQTVNKGPYWKTGDQVDFTALDIQKEQFTDNTKLYITSGVPINFYTGNDSLLQPTFTLTSDSNAIGRSTPLTIYTFMNNNLIDSVQGSKCANAYGPIAYIPYPFVDTNMIRSAEINVDGSFANEKDVSRIAVLGGGVTDSGSSLDVSWSVQRNESKPKVAFSPSTGEYYTAWSGTDHTVTMSVAYSLNADTITCSYSQKTPTDKDNDAGKQKIKLRRDPGFGVLTDYSFGKGVSTNPSLAADTNTNRLLIAWEDDQQINGQLVDLASFTNYGPLIPISTTAASSSPRTSPVAGFDNVNQRFLIVWEDARNQNTNLSNMDIYGQFVDPQGNLSGGNTIVTVARGNQLAPAMIFGDNTFRKFFVIWKDGRNPSDSDVFGQLMEFSTLPQLALYMQNSATPPGLDPILNGAIDFGTVNVGNYIEKTLVIRNDGNTDLNIQSISDPDSPYTFQSPKPVTINPGTSYPMIIRFAPYASGAYSDPSKNFMMKINSDGGLAVLYFSGTGGGFNPLSITSTTLPDASLNSVYQFALAGSGGVYPYKWSIAGMPPSFNPNNTAQFDPKTGTIKWVPIAGDEVKSPYTVTVTLADNTTGVPQKRDFILRVGTISIDTNKLQTWGVGQDYAAANQILSATSSGISGSNFVWSISGGTLPKDLKFSTTVPGKLIGIPSESGTFNFTVKAALIGSPGIYAERALTLTINPKPQILTTSLPVGIIGKGYNYQITMTGGTAPFSWSSSAMPTGLVFSSGVIFGTPTTSVNQPIKVTLTDSTGATATFIDLKGAETSLPLIINNALDIATTTTGADSPYNATAGSYYSFTFGASGGIAPYTWAVTGGALPPGLTIQPNSGGISGTPATTTPGKYVFNVQVTDSTGNAITKLYTLIVAPPLNINTGALQAWTVNSGKYSQELIASGGSEPYVWSWQGNPVQTTTATGTVSTPGALPDGLSLTSATDSSGNIHWYISGTPSKAGTYQLLMKVMDANTASATSVINLQVNSGLVFNTTSLPSGAVDIVYNSQINVSGGTAPFKWSVTSGALPNGIILDPISGLLTGMPTKTDSTKATTFNFTVTATDVTGASISKPMAITISPVLSINFNTADLPPMSLKTEYNQTLVASGGRVPYTWKVTSGSLPTGLALAADTGLISGTAAAPGTYNFIVQVTDADLVSVTRTFSITVLSGGSVQFTDGTNPILLLGYGNAYFGTSIKKTVTIKNTSASSVSIANISSGNAAFSVSGAPFTIAANGAASLEISFAPSQIQVYSGVITLTDTNGNKYQLNVTGSGISTNVELKNGTGTISYFNALEPAAIPTQNKPTDFVIQSATEFQVTGVTPGAKVTVAVTFAYMPENPIFYKIVDNQWKALTVATVTGNTVVFDVTDNGDMDSDKTAGIIRDPIVVGTMAGANGGTSTNVAPASSGGGGGGGCFIATAAFGSYLDPHVMVLRHFRDDVLLQSQLGTAFVKFYYKHSPPIADFIAHHDILRMIMRFALTPLIFAVKYPLVAALLLVIIGCLYVRRRFAAKQLSMIEQQA
jgi:hypothetical protein